MRTAIIQMKASMRREENHDCAEERLRNFVGGVVALTRPAMVGYRYPLWHHCSCCSSSSSIKVNVLRSRMPSVNAHRIPLSR